MSNRHPDLRSIARRAMLERGFLVDFPSDALNELKTQAEPDFASMKVRDVSGWLWSSIDNDDSRDLDQIEYAVEEPRGIRIYVGIADVDWFVPPHSPLDRAAAQNTTSIYTGVRTFPMLPERLSTDLSSLNENEKRLAVVIEMLVSNDGRIAESSLYPAVVENKAQLAYNSVAAWLDQEPGAETPEKIRRDPNLQQQLRLQDRAAEALRERRHEAGALTFSTMELQPVLSDEGIVVDLRSKQHNRATLLIEDFMIAANQTTALFLEKRGFPSIRRVVKIPERWDRIRALAAGLGEISLRSRMRTALKRFYSSNSGPIPMHFPELSLSVIKLLGRGEYMVKMPGGDAPGHFGLAVENYSHSTAPNRRYSDLLTQRLLKAVFSGKRPTYSEDELKEFAVRCTEKENDANKVERLVKKCAAAAMLRPRVGEEFDAVVSGINPSGMWVRLLHPPVEGKLTGDVRHLDIGHRVRVRLESVNPERGFIDFELR